MKKNIMNILCIVVIIAFCLCTTEVTIPSFEEKVTYNTVDKTIDLHAMSLKIEEIQKNDLYTPLDVYNGDITGYAANCPLCGGTLGCTGQNVLDGTLEHYDEQYGTVRIVASSKSLPCGSIVRFNLSKLSEEPIVAIVLDRGVLGTDLDLLVPSEEYASVYVGRNNLSYDILRFGYTRD